MHSSSVHLYDKQASVLAFGIFWYTLCLYVYNLTSSHCVIAEYIQLLQLRDYLLLCIFCEVSGGIKFLQWVLILE